MGLFIGKSLLVLFLVMALYYFFYSSSASLVDSRKQIAKAPAKFFLWSRLFQVYVVMAPLALWARGRTFDATAWSANAFFTSMSLVILIMPLLPWTQADPGPEETKTPSIFIGRWLFTNFCNSVTTVLLTGAIWLVCRVIPFDRGIVFLIGKLTFLPIGPHSLILPGSLYLIMFATLVQRTTIFRWSPKSQRVGSQSLALVAGILAVAYLANLCAIIPLKPDNYDSAGAGVLGGLVVGLAASWMVASNEYDELKRKPDADGAPIWLVVVVTILISAVINHRHKTAAQPPISTVQSTNSQTHPTSSP